MGAINDYAVALGGKAQREPLEALVNQLSQEHQVSLIILLSERDPYSDLERYGIEVQRAWNLPQQRQVFGLFFKFGEASFQPREVERRTHPQDAGKNVRPAQREFQPLVEIWIHRRGVVRRLMERGWSEVGAIMAGVKEELEA